MSIDLSITAQIAGSDTGARPAPAPQPRPVVVVGSATPAPKSASPSSPEQVRQAIAAANEALKAASSDLEFSQDPDTGETVVRIIDGSTHQVIRQFPSEEMLSIARAIDRMQGLLLKGKA